MKHVYRGIAVGVLQCLAMLSLAGKYGWDREHLPRPSSKSTSTPAAFALRHPKLLPSLHDLPPELELPTGFEPA